MYAQMHQLISSLNSTTDKHYDNWHTCTIAHKVACHPKIVMIFFNDLTANDRFVISAQSSISCVQAQVRRMANKGKIRNKIKLTCTT